MTSAVSMRGLDELCDKLRDLRMPESNRPPAVAFEAIAALRSLRQDVARYRWLRTHSFIGEDRYYIHYGAGINQTQPERMDSAIDAALQADKGER